MRYGIRHTGDHSWWMGSAGTLGDLWHPDPKHARSFISIDDAITVAFVECHARVLDYDVRPIPAWPVDAHLGGIDA